MDSDNFVLKKFLEMLKSLKEYENADNWYMLEGHLLYEKIWLRK